MAVVSPRRTNPFALDTLEQRLVMAADPVTPDHPLWVVFPGEAVVDGVLNDAAWANAFTISRAQAYWPDSVVDLKMLAGAAGLYIGVDVKDQHLWADGKAGHGATIGTAFQWEVETDDSMAFYFDANESRDEFFQASDRGIAFGLGSQTAFLSQAGALRVASITSPLPLAKYIMGDGAGGAPGVNPDLSLPTGMAWVNVLHGTVNDDSDLDVGWTTEVFIPWTAIGLTHAPSSGQTFGMNFDVIFDQEGGERDFMDHRGDDDRFETPTFIDDQVSGVQSSYTNTLSGLNGPVNYAKVMFLDPAVASKPAAITGLTAANTTAYSTQLKFNAPAGLAAGGGAAARGHVSSYEIRYSASPITNDSEWLSATRFDQAYVPRLAGLPESLRLIGLTPDTTYYVAVRALDAAGNIGDLSSALSFKTLTTAEDPSDGQRVVPSPMGRTLVTEDGAPFVVVGDHLGLPWYYTRNLYTGDVYDPSTGLYYNLSENPGDEGEAGPYFDMLQEKGINTMRVYLELQNFNYDASMLAKRGLPDGLYWLEYPTGVFNPDMRQFVLNILEEAGKRNIHIIFSPFDSYGWTPSFLTEFPWAAIKGGPLASLSKFFQTPQTLQLSKNRMQTVIDWVKESPYSQYLIGWEPLSEWDSNWADNPNVEYVTQFRQRAIWMTEIAEFIRQADPNHLVLNSTIVRDPRGPVSRLVFNSRAYDALTPHLYTMSSEEPISNPDADKSIMPAIENAGLTTYWMMQQESRLPIINGEWGMSRPAWTKAGYGEPSYQKGFTLADDEAMFRTMAWSGLASGQAGMGLRISTPELALTPGTPHTSGFFMTVHMRDLQRTFANFVNSTSLAIDFASFNFRSLSGRMSTTSTGNKVLRTYGITDGLQGIVYVLKDANLSSGQVANAKLTITGLRPDAIIDAEVWSTSAGVTGPLTTLSGLFTPDGTLVLNLPTFSQDVAIKFKARENSNLTQDIVSLTANGKLVSFALDLARRPFVRITDVATGQSTTQNISSIARFTGRAVDMTPYVRDGLVHLAVTDENHHLWIFQGNTATAAWSVTDMTHLIGAPGLTGDLTTYQPSWNAIHIAGLDARGHAINYWFAPGLTAWEFSDLTALFDGPLMTGGLTGYVTGWDGLNLAGLNSKNEVIVYWWAPGLAAWETVNMTDAFGGPVLTGQLDAYVTPWGGLNIAGITQSGQVFTYWWAPGMEGRWEVSNITDAAGGPVVATGVDVAVSSDGGINIFALTASNDLHLLRWTPAAPDWFNTDIRAKVGVSSVPVTMPLSSAAAASRIEVLARSAGPAKTLVRYAFNISTLTWDFTDTGIPIQI